MSDSHGFTHLIIVLKSQGVNFYLIKIIYYILLFFFSQGRRGTSKTLCFSAQCLDNKFE